MRRLTRLVLSSWIGLTPCVADAGGTELISVAADPTVYADLPSALGQDEVVSGDGRFVVFSSYASNIVPGVVVGYEQTRTYVRDRVLGSTEQIDLAGGGAQPNGESSEAAISDDGRYVAFFSTASNLVAGDTNDSSDVFVRDRWLAKTTRVSVAWDDAQSNPVDRYSLRSLSISGNGHVVAFYSEAANLVPNDTNGVGDIFVRDLQAGTTTRGNLDSTGAQLAGRTATGFSLSGDGRFLAFPTSAYGVLPEEPSYPSSVYVRDRVTGQVERVSRNTSGTPISGWDASMSVDARYVAFQSNGISIATGSSVASAGIRVYDRVSGESSLASVSSSGQPANQSTRNGSISSDGRFVAFSTTADNLVPVDQGNKREDVFLRDRQTRQTYLVSTPISGLHANGWGIWPSVSGDGRFVAFLSVASNLIADGPVGNVHVYVRDMSVPAVVVAFSLSPRARDFGDQALFTTRTQNFWLRNRGDAPLAVDSIALLGADRVMFTRSHNCGTALAPGATCRIRVTFRPTSFGDKRAMLRVVVDGDKVRDRALSGTGVPAP